MALVVALDSEPLGLLIAPTDAARPNEVARACQFWLVNLRFSGTHVILPEIVDYEARRELLRRDIPEGIDRLNDMRSRVRLVPIHSEALALAAELWAKVRRAGQATADDKALDVDAILAAQALKYVGEGDRLVVATANGKHLSRFRGLDARPWQEI